MKLPVKDFSFSKIPLFGLPDTSLASTTQNHLPLADVVDNIAVFKDGSAALVMESTSLNFGLLSEKEQQAVIAAYAALLNSLSFSIQTVVRSQRKDITNYLAYLNEADKKILNPKLKALMAGYQKFVAETIKKRNVLGKRFFVIIPFSSLELGVAKSAQVITKRKGPLPFPESYVVNKAKTVLIPRRDHLIRQSNRLGLKLKQLANAQLIELFYNVYNPPKPPPVIK